MARGIPPQVAVRHFQLGLALQQIVREFFDGHLQRPLVGYAVRRDFVTSRRHRPERAAQMLRQFA